MSPKKLNTGLGQYGIELSLGASLCKGSRGFVLETALIYEAECREK